MLETTLTIQEQDALIKSLPTNYPYGCPVPECEHNITGHQSALMHLGKGHGIHTLEWQERNKKKPRNKQVKKNLPAVIEPEPVDMGRELLAEGGAVGIDGILKMVFPDGIPHDKITPTVRWVNASRDLVS